jgi:hypothetical protein
MVSKKVVLVILSMLVLTPCITAQTRLSYADTTRPVLDWQTNQPWVGPNIVYGYGERFDLPVNPGNIDSVDFVIDSFGSDSIGILLAKDTIRQYTDNIDHITVFEHVPNIIDVNGQIDSEGIFAQKIIYKQGVITGTRTHVSFARAEVPDSFFVLLTNNYNEINQYRSFQLPYEDIQLSRSVFLSFDAADDLYFAAMLNKSFEADNAPIYAEMDIGITYENADGVQVHLSPSPAMVAFPDPAPVGHKISISGTGPFLSCEITDDAGRIVREVHSNDNIPLTQLSTESLSSGAYNVRLIDAGGKMSFVNFIIR